MQNHNSVNTTGFISLDDDWGWDFWNGCGCKQNQCKNSCNAGGVRGGERQKCRSNDADAANVTSNARACRTCPPETRPQQVVPCAATPVTPCNADCQSTCQSSACTCGKCSACLARTGNSCAVPANNATRSAGVGMVYAVSQDLGQMYNPESALRSGTLFPELNKPLNGYCPGTCNCATADQQMAFAIWELRLYLDTHPDDQQALALFNQLCRNAPDPNYATTFLPNEGCTSEWDWTQDPWPWNCRPCGE